MKSLQRTMQTLTCDIDMWQSHVTLTHDRQRPNRTSKTNFTGIYKTEVQIYELNYRETKSKIGDKTRDQNYNFAFTIELFSLLSLII